MHNPTCSRGREMLYVNILKYHGKALAQQALVLPPLLSWGRAHWPRYVPRLVIIELTPMGNFILFNELKLSPNVLPLDAFQCCSSSGSPLTVKIWVSLNQLWPSNVLAAFACNWPEFQASVIM
jgi:hypothetical protein